MSKKWAWKIFLPGFISGIVLQLNWAQGLLSQHGLYVCITTHWLRILLSGIIVGLLFYGFVRFVFDKNIFNARFKYEKRYIYGHDFDSLICAGKKSIVDE